MDFTTVMITVVTGAMTIPLLTLSVQAFAALLPPKRKTQPLAEAIRPRVAIVIPAHNEASGILRTIENTKRQMLDYDKLLVIADNCSDETEMLARQAGAEVLVRRDHGRRGKGYALDAGLRHLSRSQAPDIVVVIDADCLFGGPESLDTLARTCAIRNAPIQALDLITRAVASDGASGIAEFAWRINALLRPTGYERLGLPCHL